MGKTSFLDGREFRKFKLIETQHWLLVGLGNIEKKYLEFVMYMYQLYLEKNGVFKIIKSLSISQERGLIQRIFVERNFNLTIS